jgi:hypothetical protein
VPAADLSARVSERVSERVAAALDGAKRPALVVTDLPLTGLPDRVTVVGATDDKPEGNVRTVLVAAADRADLRRTVAGLGRLGWARVVAVALADDDRALTLRPDPAWPALVSVDAGVGWTRLELERGLEVTAVLRAFARGCAPAGVVLDHGGLRVGRPGDGFDDPATTVPPDLVVDPPTRPVVSECTGRAPATVASADLPVAVDEAVVNPTGWRRDWTRPVVDLPATTRLGPALVRDLRDAAGARLAPGADAHLVAGLAMSGVPLLVDDPARPDWLTVVVDEVSLHDLSRREELSVAQRRAALLHASTLAGRAHLAVTARVRARTFPPVSVLLSVHEPDRLAHALARATGLHRTLPGGGALEVEVVVTAHDATPDPDLVEAAAELGGLPVRILAATADSPGPSPQPRLHDLVLELDDRDGWGADLLVDLLLARRYTGAGLVGTAATAEDAETWGPVVDGPRLSDRGRAAADPGATAYRTHGLGVTRGA